MVRSAIQTLLRCRTGAICRPVLTAGRVARILDFTTVWSSRQRQMVE
jgi:hypothetical protein